MNKIIENCFNAESINDLNDYNRVRKWVNIVIILHLIFSAFSMVASIIVIANTENSGLWGVFKYTLMPSVVLWGAWGYASLITHLPKVLKTIAALGGVGFNIGKNIETTHVNVKHEFGDTYKVSSYTDNKGCLFAFIGGVMGLIAWCAVCVYIGPVITFKKLNESLKNLQEYTAE